MKRFIISLDLEEWYHLEYLQGYALDRRVELIPLIMPFVELLEEKNIRMSVFVLGDLVRRHKDLLRELDRRGHEIASHGYDHELLYNKTTARFKEEIARAKAGLEDLLGKPVRGHRAACFSMDNAKLDALQDCGFQYDSSFIRFSGHPLYRTLDLSSFKPVADLVYARNGFYEFELPTLPVMAKRIPISGGGYFRLFPWPLFKMLFSRYASNHSNFILYIHPFELSAVRPPLPDGLGLAQRLRFSVGRKHNLDKFKMFLEVLDQRQWKATTFAAYIDSMESIWKKY